MEIFIILLLLWIIAGVSAPLFYSCLKQAPFMIGSIKTVILMGICGPFTFKLIEIMRNADKQG